MLSVCVLISNMLYKRHRKLSRIWSTRKERFCWKN